MSRKTHLSSQVSTIPNWCAMLCFALVALLLYNPYMVASGMDGGLKVSQPPSYRATVAASELQHFTPASGKNAIAENVSLFQDEFEPLQFDSRQPRLTTPQIVSPPQQFWGTGLWFRPPPVF